jgi:hypothetical protein
VGRKLQVAMDRATVLAGILGGERVRFFRRDAGGPGWADHLSIVDPGSPELRLGEPAVVEVETLAGRFATGVLLAHDAGPGAPLLISHHGNSERPFDLGRGAKNLLNRALLLPTPPAATVVLVRAPLHEGPLREYTHAAGELRSWMAMLAASVVTVQGVLDRHGREAGRPTVVTGLSLGGWVTNLHRSFRGGADLYVPMLAGAHLGRQMVDSTYRRMVSRVALERGDELRETLDFADAFRAVPEPNVRPLLARFDQFARPEHQREGYGDTPIDLLETGHVGAALAGPALRAHVQSSLEALGERSGG